MKFLVALSAILAVALAAPANVYSPYILQDLAYQSVDANEDGQPDQAIAITHPVAPVVHAAPVAAPITYHAPIAAPVAAPVAAPIAYHATPVAAPVAYHAPAVVAAPVETRVHYTSTPVVVGHTAQILKPALAAPVAPAAVVVKAEEKPIELKTVAAPLTYAAPYYGLHAPYTFLKA